MDKTKALAAAAGAITSFAAGRAIDLALIGCSLATATGAVAFAGYMTMSGDHSPLVNGMEHLAIFAQPSHPRRVEGGKAGGFDMNPVGAIPPDGAERVSGYQLVGADAHFAWLREGARIFAVHPGDEVARLGQVARIEQRNGRWTLVDANGAPMLVSALVELLPSAGERFEKRMIFGNEK